MNINIVGPGIFALLAGGLLATLPVAAAEKSPDPSVMSIRFKDYKVAREFFDEAHSLGECVVLQDLRREPNRWWLRSCTASEEQAGYR